MRLALAVIDAIGKNESSLNSVDLSSGGFWAIHEDGAAALAAALSKNTVVTSVDLTGNSICSEGAVALSRALAVNRSVTHLELGQNSICSRGCASLAASLSKNTSIKYVGLACNELQDDGARTITAVIENNPSMTSLDLCKNGVSCKGALAASGSLAATCSSVTSIDLAHNEIGPAGAGYLASALCGNSRLAYVNLNYNRLGDDGAICFGRPLQANVSLCALQLANNNISDIGIFALAESLEFNGNVTSVDLSWNLVDGRGAFAFAHAMRKNHSINNIKFDGNKIGDDGAAAFALALESNDALTNLDLACNGLNSKGAYAFAEAIKVGTRLRSLHLGQNRLKGDGVAALANALTQNATVTSISLNSTCCGDVGAQAIAETLKVNTSLTKVDLSLNRIFDATVHLGNALNDNVTLTSMPFHGNLYPPRNALQRLRTFLERNKNRTRIGTVYTSIADSGNVLVEMTALSGEVFACGEVTRSSRVHDLAELARSKTAFGGKWHFVLPGSTSVLWDTEFAAHIQELFASRSRCSSERVDGESSFGGLQAELCALVKSIRNLLLVFCRGVHPDHFSIISAHPAFLFFVGSLSVIMSIGLQMFHQIAFHRLAAKFFVEVLASPTSLFLWWPAAFFL